MCFSVTAKKSFMGKKEEKKSAITCVANIVFSTNQCLVPDSPSVLELMAEGGLFWWFMFRMENWTPRCEFREYVHTIAVLMKDKHSS